PPVPLLFPYTTLFRSDESRITIKSPTIWRGFFTGSTRSSRLRLGCGFFIALGCGRSLLVHCGFRLPKTRVGFYPFIPRIAHGRRSEEHTSELQSRSEL